MHALRNRFLLRSFSILLLIVFLQSLFLPEYAKALTTGPHQPEYTSFEEAGSTDMVNLLTGDFTMNVPFLEVPGPEGGFSLPLTYNAGIGPEQEASWVGLGWTLNAGAITRAINEFPDDANGEAHSITKQDFNVIRGWTSSALGLGQIGWNNIQGHYGAISLLGLVDFSYDKDGISSVGVAGINVSANGITVDPLQLGLAVLTVASMGSAAAAAGAEAGKAVKAGESVAAATKQAAWGSVASDVGSNLLIGAGMSNILSSSTPMAPSMGNWEYTKKVSEGFLHTDYWMWLDQTRTENMYGTLYLGNSPVQTFSLFNLHMNVNLNGTGQLINEFSKNSSIGAASDMNQYIDAGKSYKDIDNPTFLANDDYSVKASGISGSITPYRLDVGTVSMPREMSDNHTRFAPVKYLASSAYKVPFLYKGSNTNSYYHHVGGTSQPTAPNFYFGTTSSTSSATFGDGPHFFVTLDLADVTLQNQRVKSDFTSTYRIPNQNHVEWLSNLDIKTEATRSSIGFIDFLNSTDRQTFRTTLDFDYGTQAFYPTNISFGTPNLVTFTVDGTAFSVNDLVDLYIDCTPSGSPDPVYDIVESIPVTSKTSTTITVANNQVYGYNGASAMNVQIILRKSSASDSSIGGYAITAANGLTYHFALPSMDSEQFTSIIDANDSNKKTFLNRTGAFANTWLLTAITGPDYVDRSPGGSANGMIDASDWGYWVKLNYGRATSNFQWRIPFDGNNHDPDNTVNTYTTGKKQLFYLNSIETRSHIALFLKETRLDSRSKNNISSLKLNEVCLIKKEVYQKLIAPTGQGGYNLPDFSYGVTNLCLSSSFTSGGTAARDYLYQNSLKRLVFGHSYDLCQGTTNSTGGGKLTLNRLAVYGRNSTKVTPDYLFEYAINPSYNAVKSDGWGLYNSTATEFSKYASESDADGAAWSLTKVTNPLGSTMNIAYERDTYSTISGSRALGQAYTATVSFHFNPNSPPSQQFIPISPVPFSVNDVLNVTGTVSYSCSSGNVSLDYNAELTVTATSGSGITVNNNFIPGVDCPENTQVAINMKLQKVTPHKKGGNLRVGSIILADNGNQFKTRYLYTGDDGRSSGVVSKEPDYIKTQDLSLDNIPGYPSTPVMYGKVSVLNGKLTDDNDWHTKQVYRFETPSPSHYGYTRTAPYDKSLSSQTNANFYWTLSHHQISNSTAKIGRLNATEVYDKNGLISQSAMTYTNQILNGGTNNYQGIYSSGSLIFDRLVEVGGTVNQYYRYSKTTVLDYPEVLKKVTNTKNGFTSETENLSWDFVSGAVTEKIERSPLGLNIKTVSKPAYLISQYSELGSKAVNLSYKNMLSQEGTSYSFKTNTDGSSILGLVSASAQTWKKDWSNYSVPGSGTYTYQADGPDVWRKSASYTYKGAYAQRQGDGSLTWNPANEFNYSNIPSNTNWQYLGETKRFDHYSMILETVNLNNIYSSVKMGYGDQYKIAEASNSTYYEMAFSSAEDLNATTGFFGGEVALGNGTVSSSGSHTGISSLSLSSGYGFVYKPASLKNNRTYRAAVWSNSNNGRIYYKLNGGAEQLSAAPTVQVGSWYLCELQVPVATFTSLEVGVKSNSGTVLFDDFRFQPLDGAMSACVYSSFGELQFTLDNNNLFTKFEYNDRGQLIKTYQESIKFNGVRLVSEMRDNFKRFHVNQ